MPPANGTRMRFCDNMAAPLARPNPRARQLEDQPRTLESLGAELRLSKERIRQLEAAAYGKLRRSLEAEGAAFAQFVG